MAYSKCCIKSQKNFTAHLGKPHFPGESDRDRLFLAIESDRISGKFTQCTVYNSCGRKERVFKREVLMDGMHKFTEVSV